jgi:predicted kinase
MATPTAHLMCGLVGSGKSTYARALATQRRAFFASLDAWMLQLHGLRFHEPEYGPLADRCRLQIWDAASQVMALGHDAVLDWNFWSVTRRRAWRDRIQQAGFGVHVHFIDVPLDVAIARTGDRATLGDPTSYVLTETEVRKHAAIFEPPSEAEGVPVTVVVPTASSEDRS